ncbi:hypothetical protein CIT292_07667 [Citrobacter youngae ATCC 29220]|uniref:Uncharacterized protein n=1 Tax=Citrobacter youngae ATCC 29220 TaxID=500640 RepID=D4BB20_9ENTR|nr:hypothetical protein CIT292_07667 [Citrobacter youngae ATCC 29220]
MIGLFKVYPRNGLGMTSNIHLMLLRIEIERTCICFKTNLYGRMLPGKLVILFFIYIVDN